MDRFVKMVDKVLPKRGNTLELPFPEASLEWPCLQFASRFDLCHHAFAALVSVSSF